MTLADIQGILLPEGPLDEADQLLSEVLAGCRQRIDVSEDVLHDALASGPWALRSVSISGFRGAANGSGIPSAAAEPLNLEFPRSSAVVVVHAENGAGKSTVADALQVALYGHTQHSPAFQSTDLRRPILVHRNAATATVTVRLDNDRGDALRLRWRGAEESQRCDVLWWIDGEPEPQSAQPGRQWAETMRAYRPVVSYDELNRRLRDPTELGRFFTDAFALGERWQELFDEVTSAHQQALYALASWQSSLAATAEALTELDEDLADKHPDVRRPDPLVLPSDPAQDLAGWLTATLGEVLDEVLVANVDRDLLRILAETLQDARDSLRGYQQAQHASQARRWAGDALDALGHLLDETAEHPRDHCPVCAAPAGDWHATARDTLRGLRLVREEFNLVSDDFTRLAALLGQQLWPLLRQAEGLPAVAGTAVRLCGLIAPLRGQQPVRGNRSAGWLAIERILADQEFEADLRQVVDDLARASDVGLLWRVARRERCAKLVADHAAIGPVAASEPRWQTALRRLDAAYQQVRDERRQQVEAVVAQPLGVLLAEFGQAILGAALEGNRAAPHLDTLDGQANIGMLSAGQYNALLLAMLLGTENIGPFGFLVLDDPVHAFDDVRLDKLAALLDEHAGTGRQVVVLTHDERLVDAVRSHVANASLIKLRRDDHGNIEQVDVSHPWHALVNDARQLLRSNAGDGAEHRTLSGATVGVLVLAFCRQAVDAVLREFVLEVSRGGEPGPRAALALLDQVFTTREALKQTRKSVGPDHPAHAVITALLAEEGYLDELNAASHGDPTRCDESPAHLSSRIDRTARFCAELLGALRS